MSNEIATSKSSVPAMSEAELLNVLRNSLYVGARDESIKMAIAYCTASGLDIFQKPVHIVPMWDEKTKSMRDVVMPGIGLYRTQAARSGAYAGVTEPEFGPDITETFPEEKGYEGKRRPEVTITYPEYCRVIVKRLLPNGQIAEFAATERWKENYATSGKGSKQPNSMWKRRPYAQLAKCAEAQALRKAFPEFGSQPTADEMEGKEIDVGFVNHETVEVRTELPAYSQEQMNTNIEVWRSAIASGRITPERIVAMVSSKYVLSDDQIKTIHGLSVSNVVDAEIVDEGEQK